MCIDIGERVRDSVIKSCTLCTQYRMYFQFYRRAITLIMRIQATDAACGHDEYPRRTDESVQFKPSHISAVPSSFNS